MRSILRWAVNNTPAMNMIMMTVLILGSLAAVTLHREEFPQFDLEMILVTVPYPGATPDEVESGICQKIEESVRSINGIKKVTSVANEGSGNVVIELHSHVKDVQKVLGEVESAVDRISTFPVLAEQPEIQQVTMRRSAIKVAVIARESQAEDAELRLREVTEKVRDDLLQLPSVTVAEIASAKDYEIDIEISETTLRKYGLTLNQVANIVRMQNLELPGGNLKTTSQELLLRGKNKRVTGEEIAKIPLVTQPNGVVLTVGDLGNVRDEFADTTAQSWVNGQPGLVISVDAAEEEDLLQMTEEVRNYVAEHPMPEGFEMAYWGDTSVDVKERLVLLQKNGLQGLILVFIVLALFLDLKLSFWVAMGIPFSVLGACGILMYFGQTLNMLSMFAFLIALGIVVDDAIVIGENIYAHREQGKNYFRAAIDGTVEVFPSVVASVATTVIAFMPMFFVTGVMGKFFAVMPLAVIAMLVISLIESIFILPCHLAHGVHPGEEKPTIFGRCRNWQMHLPGLLKWSIGLVALAIAGLMDIFLYPFRRLSILVHWITGAFGKGLDFVINRLYAPSLRFSLRNPMVAVSIAVAMLILTFGFVRSGHVPYIFFPKLDSRLIQAQVTFPNGTPAAVVQEATGKVEQAIHDINKEFSENGQPILKLIYRVVGEANSEQPGAMNESLSGSHVGVVKVELVENTERPVTSQEITDLWRERVGEIPGVESMIFGSLAGGPGGSPIEFKLLANAEHMPELEAAVEKAKSKLAEYPGVFDITDDSRPGKWEYQLTIKEQAKTLGIPLQTLANTVRGAYYGDEVMRLQRGRHEVKLMVRYPPEERRSLAEFDELRVDTGDGIKRPITELAQIDVNRGYAEINRLNQQRSITITADVNENEANAAQIVQNMQQTFMPQLLNDNPNIRVRWEGQQEQSSESVQSLMLGLVIALIAMYVLLTFEFRSYLQPMIIMAAIPFGMIGAIVGHAILGLPLTLFSMMGLVALTGIVVNDSIVLVDFINHRFRDGMNLEEALVEAGVRRFRPVMLTSLTTIAGMMPLLLETSLQAQILIPMATSICFGLMASTMLVLIMVPVFYLLYRRTVHPKPPEDEEELPRDGIERDMPEHHESYPQTPPPPQIRERVGAIATTDTPRNPRGFEE